MKKKHTTGQNAARIACTLVMVMLLPLAGTPSGFASDSGLTQVSETPSHTEATYDETQPGANDPRVKEGFAAYKQGDFKKAYDIWLPLAEAGNAEAQFRIGRLYSFGEGLEKSGETAVVWYRKAAEQDHVIALHNLAVVFNKGIGVDKSSDLAFKYYSRAAEKSYVNSQHGLGIWYILAPRPKRSFPLA